MRIYIYIVFFLMAFLAACMEDKSNYDYVDLNEIRIDSILDCKIEVFDTLRIPAKVTCSMENTDLAFVWYKYEMNDGTKCDTLSLEPTLEYKVTDLVGDYQVFLKVIDLNSGLSQKTSFRMKVIGKFDEGLLILGETDGSTSLVFINEGNKVTDVYGGGSGNILGKNPVCIGDATCSNVTTLKDIMVLCNDEKGGVVLSNADFTVAKQLEDVFFVKPEKFIPQAYYRAYNSLFKLGTADFIINDGKLHARATYNEEQLGKSIAFNPVFEGDYKLCPYAIVCPAAYLFYDNAGSGRFVVVKQDRFDMDKTFSVLKSPTEGFDPSNVGMECIYLSEAAKWNNNQSGYGIFKDKKTGELQGLRFSMSQYTDSDSDSQMSLYSKTAIPASAEGIEEATGYAMSLAQPYLYYSKGSKVYFYGMDNNQGYPVYDVDTIAGLENSVIDKIYMEYLAFGLSETNVYGSTSDTYNKVLYVSSHKEGETGHNGTIHILRLADNGTIESRTALHKNICGKTVSMFYKR